jgi:hypothetical protein
MKTDVYLSEYLAELLLEREIFQTLYDVRKIKTHFVFSNFSQKSCSEKYDRAGQATEENIILGMNVACQITKATDTHTQNIYTY